MMLLKECVVKFDEGSVQKNAIRFSFGSMIRLQLARWKSLMDTIYLTIKNIRHGRTSYHSTHSIEDGSSVNSNFERCFFWKSGNSETWRKECYI